MKRLFKIAGYLRLMSIGGLIFVWTSAVTDLARAQLIDPNQRCVYQPGSNVCQPIRSPVPPKPSGPPYRQFLDLVANSGLDVRQHATYSESYFNNRARMYCDLLARGEFVKISQEVSFPPVISMFETPKDRPRLEVAIMRVSTQNFCPQYWAQEQRWEGTNVR